MLFNFEFRFIFNSIFIQLFILFLANFSNFLKDILLLSIDLHLFFRRIAKSFISLIKFIILILLGSSHKFAHLHKLLIFCSIFGFILLLLLLLLLILLFLCKFIMITTLFGHTIFKQIISFACCFGSPLFLFINLIELILFTILFIILILKLLKSESFP